MDNSNSKLFEQAQKYIPGGVNSPARAFKAVEGIPLFINRGEGSHLYDVEDNSYIDYICSFGPLVLGHSHPQVLNAIEEAAFKGTGYGLPTELETELASMLVEAVPSLEMVRMVNSGTEAVISALRLARAYTQRDKIIKFAGCYHGHGDSMLIKAGSGVSTLGLPDSPGVTEGAAQDTISAPFNDLNYVKEIFQQKGDEIAAVILEPVPGNMGVVLPSGEFLRGLRDLTYHYGALLIFDEVMSGFRVARGGAQEYFEVIPDLTVLGKVIGGGLPVGCYGGRKDIMEMVAPSGPVYQAGTLAGNPLSMAAGIETLKLLQQPKNFEEIERKTAYLGREMKKAADEKGIPVTVNFIGSMFTLFFAEEDVYNFNTAAGSDLQKFKRYFDVLLQHGVLIPPSQFEANFMSLAHSEEDIDQTLNAVSSALEAAADS